MNKMLETLNNETFRKVLFIATAIILLVIFCVAITPVTLQNDTFYAIKTGEVITQNGIDNVDHFSWHENLPYTYPHWLYDVISYYIYTFMGFEGIYTMILTVILGLSIYFVNSKLSKNYIISFVITVGAMYLLRDYITARAQLVTFIFFIYTIYCIEQFLDTKKIRYRHIFSINVIINS